MAAAATVHGQGYGHVASPAELAIKIAFFVKFDGSCLFDGKEIRMAIGTIEPLDVLDMGKADMNIGNVRCPVQRLFQVSR